MGINDAVSVDSRSDTKSKRSAIPYAKTAFFMNVGDSKEMDENEEDAPSENQNTSRKDDQKRIERESGANNAPMDELIDAIGDLNPKQSEESKLVNGLTTSSGKELKQSCAYHTALNGESVGEREEERKTEEEQKEEECIEDSRQESH